MTSYIPTPLPAFIRDGGPQEKDLPVENKEEEEEEEEERY
jgi:hypothetical protein